MPIKRPPLCVGGKSRGAADRMTDDRETTGASSLDARLERALTGARTLRWRLWQALVLLLAIIAAIVLFAALAVKGAEDKAGPIPKAAHAIANAPLIARQTLHQLAKSYHPRLALGQRFDGEAGFSAAPGAAPEGAALVLSRFDGDTRRGLIELVALDDGDVIHAWRPDADAINARSKIPEKISHLRRDHGKSRYLPYHPLPLADGSVIFHGMDSPLVRLDRCGRIVWTIDGVFHHAIEPDGADAFWTTEALKPPTVPHVGADFQDDAMVKISIDGEILFRRSLADALLKSGWRHIVYSHDLYEPDPLHLNDIQPALEDGAFWRKGDLFLSIRNPSMVALYRPSTDEIVWAKQGPWLMQHDVDIVSDRAIAVFNNNAAAVPGGEHVFGHNNVLVYNFETGKVASPFGAAFDENAVRSRTNGLFRLMGDGSMMVEEQNFGRLLAFDRDGAVRWSYVNRAPKDGRVFQLGWSRALPPASAAVLKESLAGTDCAE